MDDEEDVVLLVVIFIFFPCLNLDTFIFLYWKSNREQTVSALKSP